MGSTKKPRKAQRHFAVYTPMMGDSYKVILTQLHITLENFLVQPDASTFNALTKLIAIITMSLSSVYGKRVNPAATHLESLRISVMSIYNRLEQQGIEVQALSGDRKSLKAGVAAIDPFLKCIPLNVYRNVELNYNVIYANMQAEMQSKLQGGHDDQQPQ